jgi:hypothetical protein
MTHAIIDRPMSIVGGQSPTVKVNLQKSRNNFGKNAEK